MICWVVCRNFAMGQKRVPQAQLTPLAREALMVGEEWLLDGDVWTEDRSEATIYRDRQIAEEVADSCGAYTRPIRIAVAPSNIRRPSVHLRVMAELCSEDDELYQVLADMAEERGR